MYYLHIISWLVVKLIMISATHENIPEKPDHWNFLQLALGLNINLEPLKEQQRQPEIYLQDISNVESCEGKNGLFCSDCNTIMLCQNATTPLYTSKCPPTTPYCTQGSCSSTSSEELCQGGTTQYKCTSEGYFPDSTNCSKFFYCPKADSNMESIIVYSCPPGFTFSSRTNNCRKTTSTANCRPFNCSKRSNQFVHYQFNPAYFGLCTENSTTPAMIVFKCPDTKNMSYDVSQFRCNFNCKTEGYFEDSLDSRKYYFCYIENRVFKFAHESCPNGYSFKVDQCLKE